MCDSFQRIGRRMNRQRARSFVCVAAALFACVIAQGVRADNKIDFTRDVQPILSENCYFCHGPDAGKRKGDLRLDLLDPKLGPFAPRDGYAIISPGKIDESVLADRIASE